MVATQWGLAADKPSDTVATHAHTDSTLSCPFSDAECFWVGPGAPAIHAPTYAGWATGGAPAGGVEVYGAAEHSNKLAESRSVCSGTSFQTGWAQSGALTTCTAGTTTTPLGNTISGKLTYASTSYAYATAFVATAIPYTLSCWMKADSGSPRPYIAATPDSTNFYARGLCPTLTSTWQRCSATGTMSAASQYLMIGIHPGDAAQTGGTAGTIWVADCQAAPSPFLGPYSVSAGIPFVGSDDMQGVSTPLTNPTRWCVGVNAKATGAWSTGIRGLFLMGTNGAANSSRLLDYNGTLIWDVYDSAGVMRRGDIAGLSLGSDSAHKIVVCNFSGDLQFFVDEARVAANNNLAGVGYPGAFPASIQVGGAFGWGMFNGTVKKFCQGKDYASVARCLR
jgi:hypothetical protein